MLERYVNKIPVEIQLKKLLKRKKFINAIETGTIRANHFQHLSTFRISKVLEDKGHLFSVDNSKKFLDFSKNICKDLNNITFIQADALEYLKTFAVKCFDFLLIDTYNDKGYVFDQFIEGLKIVKDDGVIMVDDAGITVEQKTWQPESEKAHLIVPYLNNEFLPYTLHGNMFIFNMEDLKK